MLAPGASHVVLGLLDMTRFAEQFILKRGDAVQSFLSGNLAGDRFVEGLLLLHQKLEELRNVPLVANSAGGAAHRVISPLQ